MKPAVLLGIGCEFNQAGLPNPVGTLAMSKISFTPKHKSFSGPDFFESISIGASVQKALAVSRSKIVGIMDQ